MKKKMAVLRSVFGICAAMVWWGLLYPELTMTPDTYSVICEGKAVQMEESLVEWDSEKDIYRMLLEADESQIRYRSRLFSRLEALFEKWK